jgi:hypothetical protein
MTHTLTSNGLTATFTPNGEYVEITRETRQEIKVRVEECYNEWHGLCRPTGEIATQVITGESWTEVTRAKARQIWKQMIAEGWQAA